MFHSWFFIISWKNADIANYDYVLLDTSNEQKTCRMPNKRNRLFMYIKSCKHSRIRFNIKILIIVCLKCSKKSCLKIRNVIVHESSSICEVKIHLTFHYHSRMCNFISCLHFHYSYHYRYRDEKTSCDINWLKICRIVSHELLNSNLMKY